MLLVFLKNVLSIQLCLLNKEIIKYIYQTLLSCLRTHIINIRFEIILIYDEFVLKFKIKHFQNTLSCYIFHKESFWQDVDSTLYKIALWMM